MSPAAANRDVYELLKDGIQVSGPDRERGRQGSSGATFFRSDDDGSRSETPSRLDVCLTGS